MTRRVPSDKYLTPDRPGPTVLALYAGRLLDALPDPAFVLDLDQRLVYGNTALSKLTQTPLMKLLGCTDRDLFGDTVAAELRRENDRVRQGETVQQTREWALPGGPLVFHTTKLPLRQDDGTIIGIAEICRDVTASTTADEARRDLEQKLLQSQKLESLAVMAGGIAHDFNNLLAAILGNAELALQVVATDSSAHDCLADIRDASLRAAELSKQMLAFSGRGAMAAQVVGLNEELRLIRPLLESGISKKATLTFELAKELPLVRGDLGQLRQLLLNLVTNASEALANGEGTIRITTDVAFWDRHQLASTYLDDELGAGEYVQVTVMDDGCGMDEETRAKLFEPFYSEKFMGRGLGMAAVLGIVRGHRGAIDVESTPGTGTTITLALPVTTSDAQPRRRRVRLRTPIAETGGTVLVVDDEPAVVSVAQRILDKAGFTVLTAQDGVAALELLERYGDQINLVLLDLTMPRLDGNETYGKLRETFPELPVILISGYSEREVGQRFTGTGLAGFIQKPYHPTRMLHAVHQALKTA